MPGGKGSEKIVVMECCREVTRKIASDEFREANWRQRLAVRFHLLMCCHCQRYAKQLREIGSAARTLWIPPSQDRSTIERLERQILEGVPDDKGAEREDTRIEPQ